jgi:hypothetical protein
MEESLVDRREFEFDESYIGAERIRGKRGRGRQVRYLYLAY